MKWFDNCKRHASFSRYSLFNYFKGLFSRSSIDVKFYSKFPSLSHGSRVCGIFIDCHQHAVKQREGINLNINLPIAWQWGLVGIYRLSSTRSRMTWEYQSSYSQHWGLLSIYRLSSIRGQTTRGYQSLTHGFPRFASATRIYFLLVHWIFCVLMFLAWEITSVLLYDTQLNNTFVEKWY